MPKEKEKMEISSLPADMSQVKCLPHAFKMEVYNAVNKAARMIHDRYIQLGHEQVQDKSVRSQMLHDSRYWYKLADAIRTLPDCK